MSRHRRLGRGPTRQTGAARFRAMYVDVAAKTVVQEKNDSMCIRVHDHDAAGSTKTAV